MKLFLSTVFPLSALAFPLNSFQGNCSPRKAKKQVSSLTQLRVSGIPTNIPRQAEDRDISQYNQEDRFFPPPISSTQSTTQMEVESRMQNYHQETEGTGTRRITSTEGFSDTDVMVQKQLNEYLIARHQQSSISINIPRKTKDEWGQEDRFFPPPVSSSHSNTKMDMQSQETHGTRRIESPGSSAGMDAIVQRQLVEYMTVRNEQREIEEYLKARQILRQERGIQINPVNGVKDFVEKTKALTNDLKESGPAGVMSYGLIELGFQSLSLMLVFYIFYSVIGRSPDFANDEDLETFGGGAFAVSNVGRLGVPLRIALALNCVPWIQANVIDRLQKQRE